MNDEDLFRPPVWPREMSLPASSEVQPPSKRRRDENHRHTQDKNGEQEEMKGGELEPQLDENVADEGDAEEQEFQMLDAVSAVQDELNNLEEEEAQQVR